MRHFESIFSKLGLPEGFGVVILVFSFILMISPYFSGLDFGVFKVPVFSDEVSKKLKIIGPALFLIIMFLFIPILKPKTSKSTRSTSILSKQVDTSASITSTQKVISEHPDNKQSSSEQPSLPPLPKEKGQELPNDTINDIQVIFDVEEVSSHKPKIVYFSNFHNSIVFGHAFGGDTIDMLGIWDTKTANIIQEKDYSYFKSSIHPSQVAFKNNYIFYISGWNGRTIRLFKVMGNIEKQDFVAVSLTETLLFNPERNSFIVNSSFKHEVISVAEVEGVIRSLALGPDLKYMAAGIDGRSYIYCCATGKKVAEIEESASSRTFQDYYMAFSPDSRFYAYITPKKNIHGPGPTSVVLIDVSNWNEKLRLSNDSSEIHSFAFSMDVRYIATGDNKPQVVIWDTVTGKAIRFLSSPHHTYSWPYQAIAISPDNNYIVASRFNFLEFWDLRTGDYLFRMDKGDKGYIARFASGKFYVSIGAESHISIVSGLNKYTFLDYQREHPDKLDILMVPQQEIVKYLNN